MDLEVFLTDRPGELDAHRSDAGRPEDDPRLSYAGSVVAGLVAELEVMVFEHPEHGWRNVAPGDIAYDGKHRTGVWPNTLWLASSHLQLHTQQALDRRLSAYRHPRARNA